MAAYCASAPLVRLSVLGGGPVLKVCSDERLLLLDLGQMDHTKPAGICQQSLFDVLTAGKTNRTAPRRTVTGRGGTILLVEHPPAYTLGKSGHASENLSGREARAMGAQFFHIDRGRHHLHGPGQLVCHPILDLEKVRHRAEGIDALEESVIRTVAEYGTGTHRRRFGRLGGERKSRRRRCPTADGGGKWPALHAQDMRIGVRSSRYITMHGSR